MPIFIAQFICEALVDVTGRGMAIGKEKRRKKVFKKKGKEKEIENKIAKGTNSRGQCWPATFPSSSM